MIAGAETEFIGAALQLDNIATTGLGKAMKRYKDTAGNEYIEAAHVSAGLLGEGDFLHFKVDRS